MDAPTYFSQYSLDITAKCPRCRTAHIINIAYGPSEHYESELKCSSCHLKLHTDVTLKTRSLVIRAKRSRQDVEQGTRFFSVRVFENDGREDLIEFKRYSTEDFELRARDQVCFFDIDLRSVELDGTSKTGLEYTAKLLTVHNLTIRKHMEIVKYEKLPDISKKSTSGCFFATYLYGESSAEVSLLRRYRDEVLMRYTIAVPVIEFYYFLSPKLISFLGDKQIFRAFMSLLMRPVISSVKTYYKNPSSE